MPSDPSSPEFKELAKWLLENIKKGKSPRRIGIEMCLMFLFVLFLGALLGVGIGLSVCWVCETLTVE
jgi:hypothetical protein